MKKNTGNIKCFFISMGCTLCVLAMLAGFIIVEKNTRAIIEGNDSGFLTYQKIDENSTLIKFHFMGKDILWKF